MTTRRPHTILAALAFAAASALGVSGCTFITGPGGGTSTQGGSPAPSATADSLEGTTSKAYGTEGMAPIGKLAPTIESAAMGIDADTATDERWAKFYEQEPQWGTCEDPKYTSAECATIDVPLKWNDPDGKTISLLISKLPASGEKKGSVLVNPGGPGGSGNQIVAEYGNQVTTEKLRANYDLIGFDPRGVKDSTPIRCLDDEGTDEYVSATFEDSDAGGAKAEEMWKKVTEACKANSGDLLQYVDTYSAARDMDVIRAVVGSKKLDYLGFSYGTYLGATYAELYPTHTGKIVLDGAVDPSITGDEMAAGQAKGFENAMTAFVKWCQEDAEKCPLDGSVEDGKKQVRDFLDSVTATPLTAADGRELTGALATTGVLTPLYGDENWGFLVSALDQAFQGSPDLLLMFADLANERNQDGTFESNGAYAISAVNCLDRQGVIDEKWAEKESERLASKYPSFGAELGGGGLQCKNWPVKGVRTPAPIHAKGSSTIVVIGTTGDPATPYPWAESLNEQLDNSVLLTFEGNGHTAYGRSGGCIENAVDAYFVEDTVPQDGLRCSAQG